MLDYLYRHKVCADREGIMPSTTATPDDGDFISVEEMVSMPRGRKSEIDGSLVDLLSQVTAVKVAKLSRHFGNVPKAKRQTVSGSIRKHWALSGQTGDCSITYTPEGVAQVKPRG